MHLDDTKIAAHIEATMIKIEDSLKTDTDVWKAMIPGDVIVKKFCSKAKLSYQDFRRAYITASEKMPVSPFSEIVNIFAEFDRA